MRRAITLILILGTLLILTSCKQSNSVKDENIMTVYNGYINNLGTFPITFKYDDKNYRGFDKDFKEEKRESFEMDNHGKATVIYLTHNPSGAEFRLETCVYKDYNAWDYTLYITNNTDKATGVFSDINAIDMTFEGEDPVIKGINMDNLKDTYFPYEIKLNKGITFSKESTNGSSNFDFFPYIKFEYGKGGSFIAIGWPGCWKMQAASNGKKAHFTGGQLDISTYLNPGETIRTPLIAILNFDVRDDTANFNTWRKWLVDCNMRKVNGDNMPPGFAGFAQTQGLIADEIISRIKAYSDFGTPLDFYWLDAGRHTNDEGNMIDWPLTGSFTIDTERFPDSFVSVSEELAKTGGKLLLGFEPEVIRVSKDQFLNNTKDFDPSCQRPGKCHDVQHAGRTTYGDAINR